MKRVLITGAYGFLGKYLVDEFQKNGYEVIAFGRNEKKLKALERKNVRYFVGDFCKEEDSLKATENVDFVVHGGALSTIWGRRDDFIKTNALGTMTLVNASIKNGVNRFIYVSSPSIYAGKMHRLDIKEEDFDENNKLNYYIESKIMAENELKKVSNLDWVIIRPRGLFGVGDTSIIPRLIKANSKIGIPLFNNGQNLVDMTCVENVALSLRLAVESEKAVGKIYNITNGEPTSFKDLLEKLFSELGVKPRYRNVNIETFYKLSSVVECFYKTFHIYSEPSITKYSVCTLGYSQTLDISKAREDLNYSPIITLYEGIKKYAKEYNKN